MDTVPRYVFLGLVVLVVGFLVAIGLYTKKLPPEEPPLQGAGSTFVNPLMVQWSHRYEKTETGCRIGYRSIGSGAGVKQLVERRIDFACSEAPLTDEQMARAREKGGDVVHVPLVMGAVVPVYNLPGVKDPLRFTGGVLAEVYLGKVKRWNDPALRDLNPGVDLPNSEIVVVRRSDSSGTTYVWADYLSKVSPEWKEKVGVGTEVKWPVGVAEAGNPGVAEMVQKTPHAIGYVELTYAYRLDLAFGLVRNREKEFVKASLPAVTAAAANASATIPEDLRFSLTDAPGKGSYPIVGTTWAIARVNQPPQQGMLLVNFLNWATGDGQKRVNDLFYAPLPEALAERAAAKIATIRVDR